MTTDEYLRFQVYVAMKIQVMVFMKLEAAWCSEVLVSYHSQHSYTTQKIMHDLMINCSYSYWICCRY